jgi:hypothetical protein
MGGKIMENNIETVEDVKIEGTGEKTNVATEEKPEVKMVTLEEAQKMVNSALAKKLPPKEKMDAFKKWEESQKTEADKQAEKDNKLTEKEQENIKLKQKLSIADKEIPKKFRDYVQYEVSQMEGEFDDNLELFLKENPEFTAKEETKKPETTGVKTSGVDNKETGVMAILKAKHPELFD